MAANRPVDSVEVAGVVTGATTPAAVAPVPAQLPKTAGAEAPAPARLLLLLGVSGLGSGQLMRRRSSPG